MKDKKEIIEHYSKTGAEQNRLQKKEGRVEEERTKNILKRFLPLAPAVVYDIGGGAGAYSFFLAAQGYQVHLSDFVDLHIEQAKKENLISQHKLSSLKVEDARSLSYASESSDVALLLGPLYHLTEKKDRILALKEAYRVLKPGGRFLCLEFSKVKDDIINRFYKTYSKKIPQIGKFVVGKSEPYEYLINSIEKFDSQNEFLRKIKKQNFINASYRNLNGGIVAIHSGWKV